MLLYYFFQYEDLNKMVSSTQSYLARTREGLIEAINKLELQVIFICNILKHLSQISIYQTLFLWILKYNSTLS